jgi:DNA repair exonuclease SbcCD ATPase subunit
LLIARGGKPLPTKEEDAIVAVSKKQLERERRRLKERDEEISKLRKEAIEMKEQKTQYMQAQAGGAPVPSRRSIDYTATELAGLQDLRSKLELLETQLSAKNKQIEQLEKDAGSDRIDNATAKKEVSQVRVVQQQLEDVKKALEEERLAAQRLAKKEKDYIEEIKNLKTKRPTADDGLDEATLRKRKEEFELVRNH